MKLRVVGSLEAELEARVAELTAQLAAAEISRSSEEEQMGTGHLDGCKYLRRRVY